MKNTMQTHISSASHPSLFQVLNDAVEDMACARGIYVMNVPGMAASLWEQELAGLSEEARSIFAAGEETEMKAIASISQSLQDCHKAIETWWESDTRCICKIANAERAEREGK